MREKRRVVLTVAGSDSGGGAGVQADLRTFTALGLHGTMAITCLTAQSPVGVSAIHPVPPRMVRAQADKVLADFPVRALKTGMLYSAGIIRAVADLIQAHPAVPVVVDPVMVATSGAVLLKPDAIRALTRTLIPQAALCTPNLDEARHLLGRPIDSVADLEQAALEWWARFRTPVLLKGGHLETGRRAVDLFHDGLHMEVLEARRVAGVATHGTGCTYAAAIVARLALGDPLVTAVRTAKATITEAIRSSTRVGSHFVLGWEAGARAQGAGDVRGRKR